MTRTSRQWRDKRIKKIRVYIKIHNIMLSLITGLMCVFFLLPFCIENLTIKGIITFLISAIWLCLIYVTNVEEGEDMDNYERWERHNDAQERMLEQCPKCELCEEPIQDEYAYRIDDELICRECLELNYKEAI
jgi:Ca2+/Na+ antiporter